MSQRRGATPDGSLRRWLITFSATGRARYLAHLDTMELFRRAIRRAGGRLALSGGMRPKPLLSLAMPRGVGVEGLAELAEFTLQGPPVPEFAERLQEALPDGFRVRGFEPYHHARSAAARVVVGLEAPDSEAVGESLLQTLRELRHRRALERELRKFRQPLYPDTPRHGQRQERLGPHPSRQSKAATGPTDGPPEQLHGIQVGEVTRSAR